MKKENLTATIVRTLIENARAKRKNIIENTDDEYDDDSGEHTVSKGPNHHIIVGPEGGVWGHYNDIPFEFPEYHENVYHGEEPPTRRELIARIPNHPHKREIAALVVNLQKKGDLD